MNQPGELRVDGPASPAPPAHKGDPVVPDRRIRLMVTLPPIVPFLGVGVCADMCATNPAQPSASVAMAKRRVRDIAVLQVWRRANNISNAIVLSVTQAVSLRCDTQEAAPAAAAD